MPRWHRGDPADGVEPHLLVHDPRPACRTWREKTRRSDPDADVPNRGTLADIGVCEPIRPRPASTWPYRRRRRSRTVAIGLQIRPTCGGLDVRDLFAAFPGSKDTVISLSSKKNHMKSGQGPALFRHGGQSSVAIRSSLWETWTSSTVMTANLVRTSTCSRSRSVVWSLWSPSSA